MAMRIHLTITSIIEKPSTRCSFTISYLYHCWFRSAITHYIRLLAVCLPPSWSSNLFIMKIKVFGRGRLLFKAFLNYIYAIHLKRLYANNRKTIYFLNFYLTWVINSATCNLSIIVFPPKIKILGGRQTVWY